VFIIYILANATVVTANENDDIYKNHSVVIENNEILDIGLSHEIEKKYQGKEYKEISCEKKVIFPGMINNHTHLFQTFLKGLGDDMDLEKWFTNMTAPSAAHLDYDEVYYAGLLGCMEAISCGTTTVLDYMYAHPKPKLSDAIIDSFKETKIRGFLARGTHDTGLQFGNSPEIIQNKEEIIDDCYRLFENFHGIENDRIRVWLAPAAIWTNTKELLIDLWEMAKKFDTGITAHISETPFDRKCSEELHGDVDFKVLEKYGMVGPNMLLVHCVYLNNDELKFAQENDLKISYNPISNMYLSSGIAPISEAINLGITIGLATDGAASNNSQNMIECLKVGSLLQKVKEKDPTVISANKIFKMATIEAAKSLGIDDEVGSIEKGKKADLFIYNHLNTFTSTPSFDPISTLVYSGDQQAIETVFIDGNLIYDKNEFVNLNSQKILSTVQLKAEKLAIKAGNI